MVNDKRTRTKPYGVRLDAVERYILDDLMVHQGMKAADIFRESLIMYARTKERETDRARILEIIRRQQEKTDG